MASKRGKAVEVPVLSRMPSRTGGASTVSRFTLTEKPKTPRLQKFSKYTRMGTRQTKAQQLDFKIRTSVADLVLKELEARHRCIFYQRVYILTKNIVLTIEVDSSTESILTKYMLSKTSLTSAEAATEPEPPELEPLLESEIEETSQEQPETETHNAEAKLAIEFKSSEEEYGQSLLKITRADLDAAAPKEKHFQELNFFDQFKTRLEDLVRQVESEQLSDDKLTGLLLCMGNTNSLLVIEGTEDTVASFCHELLNISNEYFETMRVFMVEDRIEETYFDEFIYRRGVSMNTTEKFPPSTANDPDLMGPQHWLIKEKLQTICRTLSYQLRPVRSESTELGPSTVVIVEEEKKERKKRKKRKKSPKHRRSKPPPVPIIKPQKDGAGDATSLQSGKLSAASGGSYKQKLQEEFENEEEAEEAAEPEHPKELPVMASAAVLDETSKLAIAGEEEATIGRETSFGKRSDLSSLLFEKDVDTLALELENEEEDLEPRDMLSEFAIAPAIYNRLLPEVQRIELVLSSNRFYMDVQEFLRLSQQIPMQADEDAAIWPTHYNYMPLGVFKRTPFDVNLTFASYDVQDESDESSSEEEGKGAEEIEGEKKEEEAEA